MEVLALFLVIFLGFSLLFRLPVAFGIGLGGAVVFAVFGYSMNSFSQTAFYGLDNFSLLAIPFFLFAGAIMEYSGISKSIFNFIDSFVGRVRASTGTVAVFACALFGALTGSTQATIAAIGKIVFPEMDKRGYEPRLPGGSDGLRRLLGCSDSPQHDRASSMPPPPASALPMHGCALWCPASSWPACSAS